MTNPTESMTAEQIHALTDNVLDNAIGVRRDSYQCYSAEASSAMPLLDELAASDFYDTISAQATFTMIIYNIASSIIVQGPPSTAFPRAIAEAWLIWKQEEPE